MLVIYRPPKYSEALQVRTLDPRSNFIGASCTLCFIQARKTKKAKRVCGLTISCAVLCGSWCLKVAKVTPLHSSTLSTISKSMISAIQSSHVPTTNDRILARPSRTAANVAQPYRMGFRFDLCRRFDYPPPHCANMSRSLTFSIRDRMCISLHSRAW